MRGVSEIIKDRGIARQERLLVDGSGVSTLCSLGDCAAWGEVRWSDHRRGEPVSVDMVDLVDTKRVDECGAPIVIKSLPQPDAVEAIVELQDSDGSKEAVEAYVGRVGLNAIGEDGNPVFNPVEVEEHVVAAYGGAYDNRLGVTAYSFEQLVA
jgi:hypothetical protein